ncbi:MAG: alanine racemase [Pseudomonadota bacterium]
MARPNQALIDLDALRHNAGHVRRLAPRSKVMAAVKADAYGHGAVAVSQALQPLVDAFAVASLDEALSLRSAGISQPILLLEGVFTKAELVEAERADLWVTVTAHHQLDWIEAHSPARPLTCWLKVNTGMNRLGVPPAEVEALLARLQACPGVSEDIVLYTHFASADNLDSSATQEQAALFEQLLPGMPRSAANSAAVIAWPDTHHDWVRPGYMLYGNSPMQVPHDNAADLRPVMTLASEVIQLRDVTRGDAVGYGGTWVATAPARIATVAIGYGDGYPRHAPNGTPVLVDGQRARLAGRVSMDMITVDVTGLDGVQVGSRVTLWGPGLPVDEVARSAGTIGYELTTGMPARTPRVLLHAQ